jgi:hypothetical protein
LIAFLLWALSPPALAVLSLREWKKTNEPDLRTKILPMLAAMGVLFVWSCFVVLLFKGEIGGFGSHYVTTRSADWFLLISLLVIAISIASRVAKGKLAFAGLLVLALWMGAEMVA